MNSDLEIKIIDEAYSEKLLQLLLDSEQSYSQYFIPFDFNIDAVENSLKVAKKDKYFGVFVDSELAGFYMLRGLDQGYDIPSYGVMISQKHSNKGFGKLTLYHAIAYCKLNGIKILMLKVHPDNLYAKKMYLDLGFEHTGTDERIGHLVLQKRLSK